VELRERRKKNGNRAREAFATGKKHNKSMSYA